MHRLRTRPALPRGASSARRAQASYTTANVSNKKFATATGAKLTARPDDARRRRPSLLSLTTLQAPATRRTCFASSTRVAFFQPLSRREGALLRPAAQARAMAATGGQGPVGSTKRMPLTTPTSTAKPSTWRCPRCARLCRKHSAQPLRAHHQRPQPQRHKARRAAAV